MIKICFDYDKDLKVDGFTNADDRQDFMLNVERCQIDCESDLKKDLLASRIRFSYLAKGELIDLGNVNNYGSKLPQNLLKNCSQRYCNLLEKV